MPTFDVVVQVVDESGNPVAGAQVELKDLVYDADSEGGAELNKLDGPVFALIRAPNYLTEPVPIGWGDADSTMRITLIDDGGGSRWVMHSGGDSMIGRRYEQPRSGDPLLPAQDKAGGALYVVDNLRRAFASADLRTINVETTVSNLPPEAAYPGKRFILNTPPEALAALEAMEVDTIVLANNHINDYKEAGLVETISNLEARGFAFTGAALSAAEAEIPVIQSVKGVRVGTLAWTSVTGSFVNDSYPDATVPLPAELPEDEMWQFDMREWSFDAEGLQVPSVARRIGDSWRIFAEAEPDLEAEVVAAAWASLEAVYPEMQDWVARRGHGGAAMWSDLTSTAAITSLAEEVDLVMVQLHSGFQYMWAPSASVRDNAYRAIDAGADIVICHHPHVLQGFEWYKGKLIAYSLGNFIFDQDFLATFPTVMLRTVWEGTDLLQVRLVPIEIQGYRPTPSTDRAARKNLAHLMEISLRDAEAWRDPNDLGVRARSIDPYPNTEHAWLRLEHHTAVLSDQPRSPVATSLSLPAMSIQKLDNSGLIDARLGLSETARRPALLVGKDTFGWGHFEDQVADSHPAGTTHWVVGSSSRKQVPAGDAFSGQRFLQLIRYAPEESTRIRPIARVTLPQHRIYSDGPEGPTPLDPDPTYTMRFMARMSGAGQPGVRFDIYHFDDSNPTEDPSSELINRLDIPVDVQPDAGWQVVEVDLSSADIDGELLRGNMSTFYLTMEPPKEGVAILDVDELSFIEWRAADSLPPHWGAYTHLRNASEVDIELDFETLPFAIE